ncbi:hypothetical protein RAK27_09840 [Carnobacterium maltaromaticum]|uniref:DUF3923 domain-containing protein n=1 Tax=Carnobacterium maltaromaticum TaxID=2751 RepID=A0AAW9K2L9_CARML|nr:hypothetical protein [Carnobacterium maltaromaticum]MDZ5758956.1 hypothetical protein [Carnobacterium maltaromaticum]
MTKKEVELQTKLRIYRTFLYVTLILVSTYSAFVGKTNLTAIDLTRGIKSALFLFIILGICSIPKYIWLYLDKKKEKEDKN